MTEKSLSPIKVQIIDWKFPDIKNYVTQGRDYINVTISTDLIKMMNKYPAMQAEIVERSLRAYLMLYPNYDTIPKTELDRIRIMNLKKRCPISLEKKTTRFAISLDIIELMNDYNMNKSLTLESALWEVLKPD
jgi:hypothetical protein